MRPDETISAAGTTLGGLRRSVVARLRGVGIATPELDGRLLVGAAADLDSSALTFADQRPAARDVVERALAFATRRVAGEPLARIVGHKEFWSLDLILSSATLVPRPDTETVVEAALKFAASLRHPALRILDLGTGSGAILLALLAELPEAIGTGTDISASALATAWENAVRLGLVERATFLAGDWTVPVSGVFDLIVANPPYIPTAEIDTLEVAVREHDPRNALDGGPDGLDAVRAIIGGLGRVLAPRGAAAFIEIGAGQREAVTAIAAEHGFPTSFVRDLAGIDRVAVLRTSPA